MVNELNQREMLQIQMEDKYFYESALVQFCEILNVPSDIMTRESDDDDRAIYIIKMSFIQLMNFYLESHQYPVSSVNITMEQFDQIVAYEIDIQQLLKSGKDFQKALNKAKDDKIWEAKQLKIKVS